MQKILSPSFAKHAKVRVEIKSEVNRKISRQQREADIEEDKSLLRDQGRRQRLKPWEIGQDGQDDDDEKKSVVLT
jgi:hypothetical protein